MLRHVNGSSSYTSVDDSNGDMDCTGLQMLTTVNRMSIPWRMWEDKYRVWKYKEDKKTLRVLLPLRYQTVQTVTHHEGTQDSWSFFTRDIPQGVNIIIFWCSISLKMISCVWVVTSRIKTTHHTTRIRLWRTDSVLTPCAANNTRDSKQVFLNIMVQLMHLFVIKH
jgi:hypothetical protein